LAGPGVGQKLGQRIFSRQEIEGDTANPGTAEPAKWLDRSLGQPQSKEDEVLSDGWPFRMSGIRVTATLIFEFSTADIWNGSVM